MLAQNPRGPLDVTRASLSGKPRKKSRADALPDASTAQTTAPQRPVAAGSPSCTPSRIYIYINPLSRDPAGAVPQAPRLAAGRERIARLGGGCAAPDAAASRAHRRRGRGVVTRSAGSGCRLGEPRPPRGRRQHAPLMGDVHGPTQDGNVRYRAQPAERGRIERWIGRLAPPLNAFPAASEDPACSRAPGSRCAPCSRISRRARA